MRIKRGKKFFIESIHEDIQTNEVVSNALHACGSNGSPTTTLCVDGKTRDLFEAPDYNFLARLWRQRIKLGINLVIYSSQGASEPGPWSFPESRTMPVAEKLDRAGVMHYVSTGSTDPINLKKATQF